MTEEELLNWIYQKPDQALVADKFNAAGVNRTAFLAENIAKVMKRVNTYKALSIVSVAAVVIFSLIIVFAGMGSFGPIALLAFLSVLCFMMSRKEEGKVALLKSYEN